MACQYYKSDGTAYNSVQEMIEDFYKSNNQLKNAAIFSADEIQESTVNKILSIKGAASYEKSKSVSNGFFDFFYFFYFLFFIFL